MPRKSKASKASKSKPMAMALKIDKAPLKQMGNVVPSLRLPMGQKTADLAGKSLKITRP